MSRKTRFLNSNRNPIATMVVVIGGGIGSLLLGGSDALAINDSMTLTIEHGNVLLSVRPSQEGAFAKSQQDATIKVTSDAFAGYTLEIKTEDPSNALINDDYEGRSYELPSITSSLSEDQYKAGSQYLNTWGYKPSKLESAENTNFIAGPTSSSPTKIDITTDPNAEANTYTLALAAKVGTTLPAGSYSKTFIVTATANEVPPERTMQGWNGCNDLKQDDGEGGQEADIVTLLDVRDNNTYKVAKLKDDGKCWMVENLRIGDEHLKPDAEGQRILNGNTTDLNSAESTPCPECTFTLPKDDIQAFNTQRWQANGMHIDSTYGGYYLWNTVTAGSGYGVLTEGGGTGEGDALSSICPKGWRLPTGGDIEGSELKALVEQYPTADAMFAQPVPGFVQGGWYHYDTWNEHGENGGGFYYASTVMDNFVQDLDIRSGLVMPDGTFYLVIVESTRCLAR